MDRLTKIQTRFDVNRLTEFQTKFDVNNSDKIYLVINRYNNKWKQTSSVL